MKPNKEIVKNFAEDVFGAIKPYEEKSGKFSYEVHPHPFRENATVLIVYPEPKEIMGGRYDGESSFFGFTVDIQELLDLFSEVFKVEWSDSEQSSGGITAGKVDGNRLYVEGFWKRPEFNHRIALNICSTYTPAEAPRKKVYVLKKLEGEGELL